MEPTIDAGDPEQVPVNHLSPKKAEINFAVNQSKIMAIESKC